MGIIDNKVICLATVFCQKLLRLRADCAPSKNYLSQSQLFPMITGKLKIKKMRELDVDIFSNYFFWFWSKMAGLADPTGYVANVAGLIRPANNLVFN